jgi:hypothetical protein
MLTVLLPSTGHGADHIENTSHVTAISLVPWHTDCCLLTSYNIRPIVACVYRSVFIEPLPGNALTCHIIKAIIHGVNNIRHSNSRYLQGTIICNTYVSITWSHVWIQLCPGNYYQWTIHVATNSSLGKFGVDKAPGILAISTIC